MRPITLHREERLDKGVIRCCCPHGVGEYQQIYLEEEPACMLIVLVRDHAGRAGHKICTPVEFPRKLEWMRTGDYECVAVVHHTGTSAKHGHYVATCLTDTASGRYHSFSDADPPIPCSWTYLEETAQRESAYILTYVRVSERGGDVAFDRKWPYSVSSKSERERLTRAGLLRDVVHLDGAPAPARRERTMENFVGAIAKKERGRSRAV